MNNSFLALILGNLAQKAIKKYNKRILLVAGKHGTKITGDLIAEMLKPDYQVQKHLEQSFWELSIPLAILGVELDRKSQSWFKWLKIIIKTYWRIWFSSQDSHWTILQMNTFKEEIALFWLQRIKPDISVLVNLEGKSGAVVDQIAQVTTEKMILTGQLENWEELKHKAHVEILVVGKSDEADFVLKFIKEVSNGISINMQSPDGDLLEFFAFQKGFFMINPLAMAIGTMFAVDMEYEQIRDKLMRADIDVKRYLHKN